MTHLRKRLQIVLLIAVVSLVGMGVLASSGVADSLTCWDDGNACVFFDPVGIGVIEGEAVTIYEADPYKNWILIF